MVEHVRRGAQPRAAFGAAELPVGRRDGSYVPLTRFEHCWAEGLLWGLQLGLRASSSREGNAAEFQLRSEVGAKYLLAPGFLEVVLQKSHLDVGFAAPLQSFGVL